MDVYLASDGGIVQIPHALSDYDSLEGIYADISAATGVIPGNALLFTDDGRELKQEVLEELWERGGHGAGQSSPARQAVYLFNRETFFLGEPERWAAELREEIIFPAPMDVSPPFTLSKAQAPFAVAYDHLCHLQSLFKAQAHALQIAYANLAFHLQPIFAAFNDFSSRVDGQLDNHAKLLNGYDIDMTMLSKVHVHESLFRKRDKDGEESKHKTLADWVHTKKMEQVRDSCRHAHLDYVARYNNVAAEIDNLAAESDRERQAAERRILVVDQDFIEALGRIELALQQIEALMHSGSDNYEQDLLELDQAMREDLASMTEVKNEFTLDLHIHLRCIADFQVRITKFTRPMTDLDIDLRQKNAFPHLERLHNLPFAYAANLVEVVYRKEFSETLFKWALTIARAMNDFLSAEAKRRTQHQALNLLPWAITQLDESLSPKVDISFSGGTEALAAVSLTRSDIDSLLKWVDNLNNDADLAGLDNGSESPIPTLKRQVISLLSTMKGIQIELQDTMERAVTLSLPTSDDQPRVSGEKRIEEMKEDYEAQIRELKSLHEQRTTALQNRQGELQEELARLRSDLGEEMVARQALYGELEEKTREQEERSREREDQSDFIIALQADAAQEKDRATDLGIRLQEALLDVDGLRNAEQTLNAQLKDLQEERSRILTELGDAQLLAHNYESELAGTRAELQATAAQLVQAQFDRDQALKEQSAEAERMIRDHSTEADGDRAALEDRILSLTKELEISRTEMAETLKSAKNAAIRREDGLKAELSFTKAQLREVQRRETVLADELAMAKDATNVLTKHESHQTELAKDAVTLVGKYHEVCLRLFGVINSSTTISGSLSLPPPPTSPTTQTALSGSDLHDSSVLVRSLSTASAFDLVAFADATLRTINLVKKWSKSCKQYREVSKNKITISNFGKGDLVLFLPTRNAAVKAWAAFNISAPHHFLQTTDSVVQRLATKDYFLARITNTEEAVVNGDSPESNPYGLAEGLRYYTHQVEEWTPALVRPIRRSGSANYVVTGASNQLIKFTNQPQTSDLSATIGTPSVTHHRKYDGGYFPPPTMSSLVDQEETGQSPLILSRFGSPVDRLSPDETRSSPLQLVPQLISPPVDPAPRTAQTHRHSVTAHATSPPSRDIITFASSSLGRPASVSSSVSSHPRGLPIPSGATKAAPASAITTAEGSPTQNSFAEQSGGRRILSKKSSAVTLTSGIGEDLLKHPSIGLSDNNSATTTPPTRFLSGLTLSRKRTPSVSSQTTTAMDILKRFESTS